MSTQDVVNVGPANPQTQSLLMQLPRELRNYIYIFLFSSTRFRSGQRCTYRLVIQHFVPAPHGLAILLSCRQAYVEVGKSWVGQVLFCFETPKAMLDRLGDIPLETRSMIRHIRVSGGPMTINYSDDWERYYTHHVLKLLPGLNLDRLTVCGSNDTGDSYYILSSLIEHSDGWKELHYKSPSSALFGYKLQWNKWLLHELQPGGWQQQLLARDGSDSGASVTIFRSNIPRLQRFKPHVANKGPWVKYTQALAPGQEFEDYQKTEAQWLMAEGKIEKEVLVVVKRGRHVDYEEKQGLPYLEVDDIRERFPGSTWAEIKAGDNDIQGIYCGEVKPQDFRYETKHVDLVDKGNHVDDYVWPSAELYQWTVEYL